ncbi:hypothetical protein F5884DRAFT_364746 [Xylogone sp. PMI_703]|nr:hypothetical protein F5884DRAFT_364746 [Xylogone sp. PMI_703]
MATSCVSASSFIILSSKVALWLSMGFMAPSRVFILSLNFPHTLSVELYTVKTEKSASGLLNIAYAVACIKCRLHECCALHSLRSQREHLWHLLWRVPFVILEI